MTELADYTSSFSEYAYLPEPQTSFGPISEALADARRYPGIRNDRPVAADSWLSGKLDIGALRSNARPKFPKTISEELFEALAAFKIKTAGVAMYLEETWRSRFFRQLDSLLDAESWDPGDRPPTVESFTTMLRMLLLFGAERRPGLGATDDGLLIAAWTVGPDRLTVQCMPNDKVKWSLSCDLDGAREIAAGNSTLANFKDILAPFHPDRWFGGG